jgi:hypothetical protein
MPLKVKLACEGRGPALYKTFTRASFFKSGSADRAFFVNTSAARAKDLDWCESEFRLIHSYDVYMR